MPHQAYTETLPNGTAFDMLFVEGGEYRMGADKSTDPDAYDDEAPIHQVRLSDFYLAKYPVTQALWLAVMGGENPSYFKGMDRPVENVSWHDAQDFIKKLNELTNKEYRLPTEAEWEYAARGGVYSLSLGEGQVGAGYKYAGSDKLKEVGWYYDNSHNETKDVGLKYDNELGLYDMSGNVLEWCADWYSDSYYQECYQRGVVENPTGAAKGTFRVLRGGSWINDAQSCRATFRLDNTPEYRSSNIGFRLASSPQFSR